MAFSEYTNFKQFVHVPSPPKFEIVSYLKLFDRTEMTSSFKLFSTPVIHIFFFVEVTDFIDESMNKITNFKENIFSSSQF